MYQYQFEVVIYSKDIKILESFEKVTVNKRFNMIYKHYQKVTNENKGTGDIIIWNLDDQMYALNDVMKHCEKSSIFILCAETDIIDELSVEQKEFYEDIWIKPFNVDLITIQFRKIMENIELKKELWLTKNYLDITIDTIPDMIWFKDAIGVHEKVNDSFCKAVGKTKEQIVGRGHCYIWDLDMSEYEKGEYVCLETEEIVLEKKKTCLFDEQVKCKDGMRLLKTYKAPVFSEDGKDVLGTVGIAHDVTSLENLSMELNTIFDGVPFAVAILDTNNKIQSVNNKIASVFGVSKIQMMETPFEEWTNRARLEKYDSTSECYNAYIPANGENMIVEMSKEKIVDVFDNEVGFLVMFRDVTLNQRVYEKTLLDANTDYLTGLYNRRYLSEYIEKNRGKHYISLLYFDVDNFKELNDTFGHPVGDKVLVDIANQLRLYFIEQNIFRLGGDEFLVLLPDKTDINEIKFIAQEVRDMMEHRFREELNFPMLSVSIGIACDTDRSVSPDELLTQGDAALYKAKQKGKNCICTW